MQTSMWVVRSQRFPQVSMLSVSFGRRLPHDSCARCDCQIAHDLNGDWPGCGRAHTWHTRPANMFLLPMLICRPAHQAMSRRMLVSALARRARILPRPSSLTLVMAVHLGQTPRVQRGLQHAEPRKLVACKLVVKILPQALPAHRPDHLEGLPRACARAEAGNPRKRADNDLHKAMHQKRQHKCSAT